MTKSRKEMLMAHLNSVLEVQDELLQAHRLNDPMLEMKIKDRYGLLVHTLNFEELFEIVAESGERKATA